jgi:beta-galactosidase/beta-glucuronidase
MHKDGVFDKKITVPFCPESPLSGIGFTDFIPAVWYRRVIEITKEQLEGRVLLHFGACDYETAVYVNGDEAGRHIGGYGSFTFDISRFLREGVNTLTVNARDDARDGRQPSGKQSERYGSYGCMYTRTTGIWQTVWLEFVPKVYIKKYRAVTNAADGSVGLSVWLSEAVSGARAEAAASFNGRAAGSASAAVSGDYVSFTLMLNEKHLWDTETPNLYGLTLTLDAGGVTDTAAGYFGLRTVTLADNAILLNGRKLFQRLVLDQGFYPDGIYTAPTDDALVNDIKISMDLGFNGARLHEKAFEERFLYHADRLGYLVWGEYANWGYDHSTTANISHFLPEWVSLMERDFNHPALVGWCPFNETWDSNGKRQDNDLLAVVYGVTKALDPTRPVIDTSGNYHVVTDIYDVHDYMQDVTEFTKRYGHLNKGEGYERMPDRQTYGGQPFFVSEYGGARWAAGSGNEGWGYGDAPKTEDEFAARYEGLTGALLNSKGVCAFCYTQLYDVEQEKNGLYTYSREKKFPQEIYERITAVNKAKAAAEDTSRN